MTAQNVPDLVLDIAKFLVRIQRYQKLHILGFIGFGSLALPCFCFKGSAVLSLFPALISGFCVGRWWQTKKTIEQLLNRSYLDMTSADSGFLDKGEFIEELT